MAAEYITNDEPLSYVQTVRTLVLHLICFYPFCMQDMPFFRNRMMARILQGQLEPRVHSSSAGAVEHAGAGVGAGSGA